MPRRSALPLHCLPLQFSSLLVAALGLVGVVAAPTTFSNLHGDDRRAAIIADVNSKATTWVAGHHERFAGKPFHAIKRQLGVLDIAASEADKLPLEIHTGFDMFGLPDEFDPREAWPQCKTIREVRDQSDCGSCWAFGAVEAASDRVCIATGGKFQPHLSAQDMLACCSSCGMGCNGGYPSAAWSYLKNTGVVTGGNYNDKSWCSAYSMPNCDHHTTGQYEPCGSHDYPTPACPKQCDADSTYTTPFAQDKVRFNSSYSVGRDPTQIMQELMTRGPVEAAFSVYDDFPSCPNTRHCFLVSPLRARATGQSSRGAESSPQPAAPRPLSQCAHHNSFLRFGLAARTCICTASDV